ncbi:MAG: TfpX/TfpZ family type IV pilin accessory protein [Pseudomonas sp.]|uniref:TfpX/TfpZ family type IV pilin accessory protein n=1 Tax=Pseudomonas sp. TaxID=306 RepID=UPI00339858E9
MPARLKAFLLHLTVSAFIAFLVVLLVFKLWYPAPLHLAVGVTDIFLLLLAVDVVLGPLLTLVVFKVGKKSLVFDLTVIAVLQLCALAYGLWSVSEGRPAWLVFNVDRFDLVQVIDIDARKLDAAVEPYRHPSLFGPGWVGAVSPDNPEQRQEILLESAMAGVDIAQRPNLYRPLVEMADAMRKRAFPLEQLERYNDAAKVQAVLQEWPKANAWLPLKAKVKSMVVLIDKESAAVIAIVDLAPWQ